MDKEAVEGYKGAKRGWMYNTASFFTLGFTQFNMYMSLIMIGLAIWFISVNYKKLILSIQNEIETRLNRLFSNNSGQPLYKVFYGFNHTNTKSWVAWTKTQNLRQQTRAFTRLSDYLQEPPKELGLITLEVVRAVVAFQHEDSYEVLTTLLKNARNKWGQYKALNCFYEEAALGIIQLNEDMAKKFLLNELSEIKKNPDVDGIKKSILTTLTHISDKAELAKIFEKICLDSQHSSYIRNKAIVIMQESSTEEEFFSFLNNVSTGFLKVENFNNDDLDVYNLVLEHTSILFAENKFSEEIWQLWSKAFAHKVLNTTTIKTMGTKLKDPSFIISSEKLQYLLRTYPDLRDELTLILAFRFNLSKEELEILQEANVNSVIFSRYQDRTKAIEIYDQCSYSLPETLENNYNSFLSQIQKLNSQMLLITGKAELEKIVLAELVAKELKRTFIHVNVSALILSPDQLDKTLSLINERQNYLIYLENIFEVLTNNETNNRIKKFNEIVRKLQYNPRVIMVASITQDLVDIYDIYPELTDLIRKLPNEQFKASIDVSLANARFKQKVYSHYEIKLKDDRDFTDFKFDQLLYQTENLSAIEFLNYFLDYLSTSLLTAGKLLPIEERIEKELVK